MTSESKMVVYLVNGVVIKSYDGYANLEVDGVKIDKRNLPEAIREGAVMTAYNIKRNLDHYERPDGTVVSVEEYKKKGDEIGPIGDEGDDGDEPRYKALEAEYEWKKFILDLKAVHVEERVDVPVEIVNVSTVLDTGSPYIKCFESISGLHEADMREGRYFSVIPNGEQMIKESANRVGLNESDIEGAVKKDLRFVKWKDHYVFTGDTSPRLYESDYKTIEEAQEIVKQREDALDKALKECAAKYSPKELTIGDAIQFATTVLGDIKKIPGTSAAMKEAVRKLVHVLEKQIEDWGGMA